MQQTQWIKSKPSKRWSKMADSKSKILIAHWNANGFSEEKSIELTDFIKKYKIDVVLLNETKFHPKNKCSLPGYTCYRKDRASNAARRSLATRPRAYPRKIERVDDGLKSLLCIKITIEGYNKPKVPTQCFRCQRFHHVSGQCRVEECCGAHALSTCMKARKTPWMAVQLAGDTIL